MHTHTEGILSSLLGEYFEAFSPLKDRAKFVLHQFPQYFPCTPQTTEHLSSLLDSALHLFLGRICTEFRRLSWYTEDIARLLADRGAIPIATNNYPIPGDFNQDSVFYLRLLGLWNETFS